jgi:hypothetical protein
MHRQRAGDDVERRVRHRQALRDADGEGHARARMPPRVGDGRQRPSASVDPGSVGLTAGCRDHPLNR